MTQQTLVGGVTKTRALETTLSNNEKRILQCLRSHARGLTHDEIRYFMRGSGISTFDNRLRELRRKGFVESHEDSALGQILWYPKEDERK